MKLRLLSGSSTNLRRRYRLGQYLSAVALCVYSLPPWAQLKVEVTEGIVGGVPISILPFQADAQVTEGRRPFARIIANDLAYSGLFSIVPNDASPLPAEQNLNYSEWLLRGVDKIVFGTIARKGNMLEVQIELHDTIQRRRLLGQVIRTTSYDGTAHYASDAIYRELTGTPGIFRTHIAFVASQRLGWRQHRFVLYVSDADGHNEIPVYSAYKQLMSPTWSPDAKKLAYVSYESGIPEIIIQNLAGAEREKTSKYIGSAVAPDWSHDGTHLAYVVSTLGNSDIYIARLSDWLATRITSNPAIDTEPAWMPDGTLVFTSDRSGQPQLYQVRPEEGVIRRLTHDNRYNSDADISPDGRHIVFLSQRRGDFSLIIRNLKTGDEREIARNSDIERPRFTANGQLIGYLTAKGTLNIMTVDGMFSRPIPVAVNARLRSIAWSPFIQP